MDNGKQPTFNRKLAITLIAIIAALLVWHTLHMFLLIFLGIIFAVFLKRTGELIAAHTRIPTRLAMSLLILFLFALAGVTLWLITPKFIAQFQELIKEIPSSWQALREKISQSQIGRFLIQNLPPLESIAGSFSRLVNRATAWLYSFLGALTGILIILFIGLYIAFGGELYIRGLVKLFPPVKRDRARRVLDGLGSTLYWWLIGRIVSMMIIGSFTMFGLWLMGLPLAFILGLFAAVMTFIPNIGPIISAIPALLIALQRSWFQALYVLLLYTLLQTVESYFITPMIQRRAIAMPPAMILSAQIVMGVLQGVLGILVATPLVAAAIVLIKLIYIQGILGDQDVEIEAEHMGRKQ